MRLMVLIASLWSILFMEIDDNPVFKVENIRQQAVVQLRRKDFKERYRAEFAPHAECAPVAKAE